MFDRANQATLKQPSNLPGQDPFLLGIKQLEEHLMNPGRRKKQTQIKPHQANKGSVPNRFGFTWFHPDPKSILEQQHAFIISLRMVS